VPVSDRLSAALARKGVHYGWVVVAAAVRLLLFGLMGPFAAAFINRYGVRKVTLTALGSIASGLAAGLLAIMGA
jgi:hypothetical protein